MAAFGTPPQLFKGQQVSFMHPKFGLVKGTYDGTTLDGDVYFPTKLHVVKGFNRDGTMWFFYLKREQISPVLPPVGKGIDRRKSKRNRLNKRKSRKQNFLLKNGLPRLVAKNRL